MANIPLIKKGHCINPECQEFAKKTVFEIGVGEEFVCPECQGTLVEIKSGGTGMPKWIGAVVAAIVIAGGAVAYFLLSDKTVYVTGIQPENTAYTVVTGENTTIAITVDPEDATDKTLAWSSSDEEVLTVAGGKMTGVKAGKATVTITSNDGKASAAVEVTVTEPEDTTVYVSAVNAGQEKYSVKVGETVTIAVTVEPEDAADKTLAWSSSDEGVLTVADGVVTGVKAGKATVTIASNDGKASAAVEVEVEVEAAAQPAPAPALKGVAFSGALKNGYPHGTGTMTFKAERKIDLHDQKGRTAKAGDYLIGEWDQGHLIQARWYDSANNLKETIVLGKAMNPELDRSLYK